MHIVSVSRRTDIPAFYMPWFLNRLKAGYALVENPFGGRLFAVSLIPSDVRGFVFWSKNFAPLIPHFPVLERRGDSCRFHFTITGLPRSLEPRVPETQQALQTFDALVERAGSKRVTWRYDPVLISNVTDADFHLRTFRRLCRQLENKTASCVMSFPTRYGKVERRFAQLEKIKNIRVLTPTEDRRLHLARELASIAREFGITLHSCCGDYLIGETIRKAHCVDWDSGEAPEIGSWRGVKRNPTRSECGCRDSRDIGAYDTCLHGCVYCYATGNSFGPREPFRNGDPDSDILAVRNTANLETRKRAALQQLTGR